MRWSAVMLALAFVLTTRVVHAQPVSWAGADPEPLQEVGFTPVQGQATDPVTGVVKEVMNREALFRNMIVGRIQMALRGVGGLSILAGCCFCGGGLLVGISGATLVGNPAAASKNLDAALDAGAMVLRVVIFSVSLLAAIPPTAACWAVGGGFMGAAQALGLLRAPELPPPAMPPTGAQPPPVGGIQMEDGLPPLPTPGLPPPPGIEFAPAPTTPHHGGADLPAPTPGHGPAAQPAPAARPLPPRADAPTAQPPAPAPAPAGPTLQGGPKPAPAPATPPAAAPGLKKPKKPDEEKEDEPKKPKRLFGK
jgi:hypothetical protein